MRRGLVQSSVLVPALGVLVLAGLLVAHDATWSIWVGGALGFVTVLVSAARGRGRFGTALGALGAALVFLGTAAAVSGLWIAVVGAEATATVTHVRAYTPARTYHVVDDDSVELPDGHAVAGPLHDLRHGLLQVGDRVRITYDPSGLIRFPTLAGDLHHPRDAVGGPVAVVVGFGLMVFTRLRRPSASPGGDPRRRNITVDALARRLAAEDRDRPARPAAGQ